MSEETIFREVDEEVRQEELKKLWNKYGTFIIAVAVLIVLGVAGMKGWKAWNKSRIEAAGASFSQAMDLVDAGKLTQAEEKFKALAASGVGGYKVLARFKAADLIGKDKAAKVAAFDAIAKDTGNDKVLRQMARIRAALLRLDEADGAEMETRLKGLSDPLNPWRHTARELLGLHAWKHGDYKKANEYFTQILRDAASPRDIRARAARMRDLIAPHLSAKAASR
ncbi:MAG TPA: tetratricopeptide repeat protein [Rhizobiales bacterium]|nr:tetratricopeptide repeat protein [Hyphomicrobiales bacterium]